MDINDLRNREGRILQAMAKATLVEQTALMAELSEIRSLRQAAIRAEGEVDFANAVVRDTLSPAYAYSFGTTAASDWIGEVATTEGPYGDAMAVEANLWFQRAHPAVKADAAEFTIQAQGMARVHAGRFGADAPAAERAFLDQALHLRRSAGLDKVAGIYCKTHQVWVGDGNASTHEGCDKEQRATDKTKEARRVTADYYRIKVDVTPEQRDQIDRTIVEAGGHVTSTAFGFEVSRDDLDLLRGSISAITGSEPPAAEWVTISARHTAAPTDGQRSFCRICGVEMEGQDYAWYALSASAPQRDVGRHQHLPARLTDRPGEYNAQGDLVPGTPGGEGGQYDAPAGTIFDGAAEPITITTARRTAAEGQTCSVCGDKIAQDPESEDPSTWHHDNGEKHDHEAKPSGGTSEARKTAALCSCAHNSDGSVTTMLCSLHAKEDPCWTMARVTGQRRRGSIVNGVCSACGWTDPSKTARRVQAAKCSNCANGNHTGTNGTPGCKGGSCTCSCRSDKQGARRTAGGLENFGDEKAAPFDDDEDDETKEASRSDDENAEDSGEDDDDSQPPWLKDKNTLDSETDEDSAEDDNDAKAASRRFTTRATALPEPMTSPLSDHFWTLAAEVDPWQDALDEGHTAPDVDVPVDIEVLEGEDDGPWPEIQGDADTTPVTARRRVLSLRRSQAGVDLTNVSLAEGLSGDKNLFKGTDPSGNVVTFRVSEEDAASLRSVLFGDLAGNFSGVEVDEADIVREGRRRTAAPISDPQHTFTLNPDAARRGTTAALVVDPQRLAAFRARIAQRRGAAQEASRGRLPFGVGESPTPWTVRGGESAAATGQTAVSRVRTGAPTASLTRSAGSDDDVHRWGASLGDIDWSAPAADLIDEVTMRLVEVGVAYEEAAEEADHYVLERINREGSRRTAGAYEDGGRAFAEGKPRVAPPEITNWGGEPGDTDLAPIQEWYRGWDAANLAAPVEATRRTAAHVIPDNVGGRDMDPNVTAAQIGKMNVMAISGGRVAVITGPGGRPVGISLPVSNGYAVNVFLANDDLYIVQRVYRGVVKGQVEGVYADMLGDLAYDAGMFRTNEFGGHGGSMASRRAGSRRTAKATCIYDSISDNHSDDILAVYHGRPEPTYICGYHEMRFGVPGSAKSPLNSDGTPGLNADGPAMMARRTAAVDVPGEFADQAYCYREGYEDAQAGRPYKGYGSRSKTQAYSAGYTAGGGFTDKTAGGRGR